MVNNCQWNFILAIDVAPAMIIGSFPLENAFSLMNS